MAKRLGDDDGKAVDVVLDQHASNGHPSKVKAFVTTPDLAERVDRVQRLLHLLDQLPALDPPHDLVGKTLARIDQGAYMRPGRAAASTQTLPSEPHQA